MLIFAWLKNANNSGARLAFGRGDRIAKARRLLTKYAVLATFLLSLWPISTYISPIAAVSTPSVLSGDFKGFIDLADGRQIYAECAGEGSPTVLLVSGYRTRADVWTDDRLGPGNSEPMVLPALAAQTRVCAYDRPGTLTVLDDERFPGRSDAVPMPRTITDVVTELREVREQLAGNEPVVFVGHSFGGAIVRLYAAAYPDDIAGIVLVDAYSEFVAENMSTDAIAAYARYASAIPDFLADYTDYETIDFAKSASVLGEATAQTPLPAIPYIVLSKGQPFGLQGETPGFTVEQLETAWTRAQTDLAQLLPDTPHLTVADSGHYIQLQHPELVTSAVLQIVREVQTNRGLGS